MKVWKHGDKITITDDSVVVMWNGLNKEEQYELLYEFDVKEIKRKGDEVIIKGKLREEAMR